MILNTKYDSYTLLGYIGKESLPENFFTNWSNYAFVNMNIIFSDLCMNNLGLIYRINTAIESIEIFGRFFDGVIPDGSSLSISFQVIININNSNYLN